MWYQVAEDGALLGGRFSAGTAEDAASRCTPFVIREPDGTITETPIGRDTPCPATIEGSYISARYIVTVVSNDQSDIYLPQWSIIAYDRVTRKLRTIASAKPDAPPQPLFFPSVDGDHVTWREFTNARVTSGDDIRSYVADLRSGAVAELGTGLNTPTIAGPYIYASRYGGSQEETQGVRIELATNEHTELPVPVQAAYAAATRSVLAAGQTSAWLLDAETVRITQTISATLGYPRASGNVFVWRAFPDAASQQIQVMDERCPQAFGLDAVTNQGLQVDIRGDWIMWATPKTQPVAPGPVETITRVVRATDLLLCR